MRTFLIRRRTMTKSPDLRKNYFDVAPHAMSDIMIVTVYCPDNYVYFDAIIATRCLDEKDDTADGIFLMIDEEFNYFDPTKETEIFQELEDDRAYSSAECTLPQAIQNLIHLQLYQNTLNLETFTSKKAH